jgi:protocatechuate 3,4-dioxygenase alpha subunit|tara:strand:+ start:1917 stop:2495 length:579 start_codon:yes stop_codon:yes gene_type:complete
MNYLNNIYDETPFQTAGPFLHIGCLPNSIGIKNIFKKDLGINPFERKFESNFITISGSVFDGNGEALDDIMLETWQCDENGYFFNDQGFARFVPDPINKKFVLKTLKPGVVKEVDGKYQSPHISMSISSRGINMTLNTRIYFEDDDIKNDPLLSSIEQKDRIHTLIAKKDSKNKFTFDVFLQGVKETIFLNI